jgi:Ran GTPase-activating protein (RanGAP) involved in mRNA processing and transport
MVSEGVAGVARGLSLNRTLTTLDLSANDISTKSTSRLADALAGLHSLENLFLADNNALGTVGVVLLCEGALRTLENLARLDLRRCGIGLRGFAVLTDAVGDMISLQELLLDGNNLADASATRGGNITGGLGTSSSLLSAAVELRHTDARNTDYVDNVCKRLHLMDKRVSPRLLLNTALRTLSLAGVSLGDRVLEDLARVLASHKALQALNVSANQVTDLGAQALADMTRSHPTLRSVHAADNCIGDEGGAALCMALASQSAHVSFLSLRVNNVGKNCANAALHALARKRTLHMDLGGNKIPWILFSKMQELSNKNKRNFEASLSARYQEEWERLQQRHEYRLSVFFASGCTAPRACTVLWFGSFAT